MSPLAIIVIIAIIVAAWYFLIRKNLSSAMHSVGSTVASALGRTLPTTSESFWYVEGSPSATMAVSGAPVEDRPATISSSFPPGLRKTFCKNLGGEENYKKIPELFESMINIGTDDQVLAATKLTKTERDLVQSFLLFIKDKIQKIQAQARLSNLDVDWMKLVNLLTGPLFTIGSEIVRDADTSNSEVKNKLLILAAQTLYLANSNILLLPTNRANKSLISFNPDDSTIRFDQVLAANVLEQGKYQALGEALNATPALAWPHLTLEQVLIFVPSIAQKSQNLSSEITGWTSNYQQWLSPETYPFFLIKAGDCLTSSTFN